jgi:tetratricopeptide (TPR) repeat protein
MGRIEEAARQFRQAVDTEPTSLPSQDHLAVVLGQLGRHEAIDRLRAAVRRAGPNTAGLRAFLGGTLSGQGRYAEALTQFRQAVALDPKDNAAQGGLRTTLVRMGRAAEARVAWHKALQASSYPFDDWCGYAEFCLFFGQEEEYRRTRQALLSRFGSTTDPHVAARTAQACLLWPATGDALRQAVALAERAAAAQPKYPDSYPHFLFAQGLAEYRRGRFDRVVSAMRGDAGRLLSRAPRLVLALARCYTDAFAADPSLTEDLAAGHRYRAARAAAQAGCGRGEDAPRPREAEGKRWRDQARRWLRADLTAWNRAFESGPAARELRQTLTGWRCDPDLAGLRDTVALEKVPAEERKEWLALWREVVALLRRAASP